MITQGHSHEHSLLSYLFAMARWLDVKSIKSTSMPSVDHILGVRYFSKYNLPQEVARGVYFHGRGIFVVILYFSSCFHLWL